MAYGIHEKKADKTVAVFDLGGGTFDISVVDLFEGSIEVRASAGEAILGGEDFTRAIARKVLADRSIMFETAELKTPKKQNDASTFSSNLLFTRSITRLHFSISGASFPAALIWPA